MKYIVYDTDRCVLFDEGYNHGSMAMMLGISDDQVDGAGVVQMDHRGILCSGESIMLKVKSRGNVDAAVIRRHMGL